MLSIRMQRLGRKGHATYRIIVQDSHQSPSSGKYIALLGSYDPHTKSATLSEDKIKHFLKNGAQPSEKVVKLFKTEKISLPKWVEKPTKHKREIRNPDKLRKNRPAGVEAPPKPENKDDKDEPVPAEDKPAEESKAEEKPAETQDDKKDETEAKPEADNKEDSQETPDKDEPEKPEQETKKQ